MGASVIIAAAGSASRMNGIDKIMHKICGREVFMYSVKAFDNAKSTDKIVVVTSADKIDAIKNCLEKYPKTAGISVLDTENIKNSIEIMRTSGVDYEFRTTVTKELHTPQDFVKIGELIKGAKRYYIQNFLDSGSTIENTSSPLDNQGLKALLEAVFPYVENSAIRGE